MSTYIEQHFEKPIDRKKFLRTVGSATLISFLGIKLTSCDVTDATEDDDRDDIVEENGTVTINLNSESFEELKEELAWKHVGDQQLLLVNVDGEKIRAFSDECPHQGCRQDWEFEDGTFHCTCHGSRFDTTGQVIESPATEDLTEYETTRENNELTVILS